MKRAMAAGVCGLCIMPVLADELILTAHDKTFYSEMEPEFAKPGQLTGISDIYYYYDPINKIMTATQTEWIADGTGGEYEAPYESTFHYADVTFDNMCQMLPHCGPIEKRIIHELKTQMADYIFKSTDYVENRLILLNDTQRNLYERNIQNVFDILNQPDIAKEYDNRLQPAVWTNVQFGHWQRSGIRKHTADAFSANAGLLRKDIMHMTLGGLGYNYTNAFAKTNNQSLDINSHNIFIYGQYKPGNLYINGILGQVITDYDDVKSSLKIANAYTFYSEVDMGYSFSYDISPEIGLRYSNTWGKFNDELIDDWKNNRLTTFVLRARYKHPLPDVPVSVGTYIGGTYDIWQSDTNVNINIADENFNANIRDKSMPLGIEAGIGLLFALSNINVGINYNITKRTDFISHNGKLYVKYIF